MKTCYSCSKDIDIQGRISIRETCLNCGNDLHTCHNCRFFDEKSNRECKEPSAELITDKDKYNRCDWFDFAGGISDRTSKSDDAKAKLEALFKK